MSFSLHLRHSLHVWSELFQAERERWAYALPVLMGVGVGFYFLLPFEPPVLLAPILTLFALWACLKLERESAAFVVMSGVLAIFLGVSAAGARTTWVNAPILDRKLGVTMVTGVMAEREAMTSGTRILLRDVTIEHLEPARTPHLVRVNVRGVVPSQLPDVGSRVEVLANLLPPAEPSAPGAYDFRRQAYFDGLGAYGQALRAPVLLTAQQEGSLSAETWREAMAAHITARIAGSEGAIAVALMTGERGAIDATTNSNMRAAGTAHMLSISGMHIGMVGGFVFFLVRAIMALWPWLALRVPVKQIAAVVALLAVVVYTLLVGAPIPAQRSALMTGLVFCAILLDRQVLAMRAVAMAAAFILLLFPESLLNPGFQMSFAAIVMLIAAYEKWEGQDDVEDKPRPGWVRRAFNYVVGIIVTSLIAGAATMPFGAWHFHRLQLLGVLGNLVAVPLTGFIIMPAVVVVYALAPLGLDGWALDVLGWGLRGVTVSAAWIAALPGADVIVPAFPLWVLLVMVAGGVWIALWRSSLRWVGGGLVVVGCLLVPLTAQQPVLLVSSEGMVAVRGADGRLYSDRARTRGIAADEWSRSYNQGEVIGKWDIPCDRLGCVAPGRIALPKQQVAQIEDCQRASILVAPKYRIENCTAPIIIDRVALRRYGSYAVYADGSVITSKSGSPRPWQSGYNHHPYGRQ